MAFKMKNPSMAKLTKAAGDNRVAMKMKMESAAKMKQEAAMKMKKESMAKLKEEAAMKMKQESAMKKPLVGDQDKLNEGLKKAIKAAPSKMKEESSMKMGHKSATKLKKPSPAKQKMNMVKGPDGKMVPDFAVDGKGANDMKSGAKMKDDSPAKFKTYKQAYADLSDAQKKKYDGYSDFLKQAKAYNKKTYGTTEPTKTSKEASKAMGEKVTKKDLKKTDFSAAIRVDKANPKKTKAELAAEKQKQDDAKEGKMFSDKKRAAASTKTKKDDRKYRKAEKKREKADKALAAGKFDKAQRKYRKALTKEEQGDKARRSPATMVKAVRKEQKVAKIKPTQKPALKNDKVKPVKQTVKKLRKSSVTAKF